MVFFLFFMQEKHLQCILGTCGSRRGVLVLLLALADTSPTSASQAFVSTDGVFNARARVLGGGTCINAGFYTRASSSELVEESYPWVEKKILHWPKLAPWQQAGHCSTAAELRATRNPKNLQVLIYATLQKIMFDKTGKQPKAVGVLFKDEKGKVETEFEDLSEDGKIQGWESKGGNISSQDSIIDLDYYITVHALMDVVHIKRDESKNFLARIGFGLLTIYGHSQDWVQEKLVHLKKAKDKLDK
ncbi:hypothetical protein MKW98_000592 [Papaver atlanticum]|uniref:Uncharacterized protein n=1 Tax=Papaver atlanticum TaxID=357466 RepID=A0AAD4X7L3_9MAGN|nr:hypothetical protein MKW98_000592 [Papaver atlanticum]